MESHDASFASRDLACRVGGACAVRAGFGAAALRSSSLSLRAATRAARAGGKFRAWPLCLRAGYLRARYLRARYLRTSVRDARYQFAAEQCASERMAPERLGPKRLRPKQPEPKQLQSIRAARRHGGGAGERQRRAGVAGRACHQARERRQSARGQPRQLRADADQARHRARHGIYRLGGGAARSAGQHDLRGALSRRRLSRRRRQRKPRRRALCQRLLLPGQGAGFFAVCGRGVVRLWRPIGRLRSRSTRRSATTRRSIARGIIGITRCSAIFTSPRVRGEVEERSDEGEGASPRF